MERQCIYCGIKNDLSKSDIIPDALTNAKIINKNVCREEHNSKFSDYFESEIIEKLAFLINELDVKSSKNKNYSSYKTKMSILGVDYETKISSQIELFQKNKVMPSKDGKFLIAEVTQMEKESGKLRKIAEIDFNSIEIFTQMTIDLSIFFSSSMFRLMAKIGYEWYCLKNNINGKHKIFEPIIEFITKGIGEDIVYIVQDEEVYSLFYNQLNFGSHTLLSYVDQDGSVNVIVSLFNIAIYKIRLLNQASSDYDSNVLFQELLLNSKRIEFKNTNYEQFIIEHTQELITNFLNMTDCKMTLEGLSLGILQVSDKVFNCKNFYIQIHPKVTGDLDCTIESSNKLLRIIKQNLNKILQASALTLRSLKRFTNEFAKTREGIFKSQIQLNVEDKKTLFLFYILYLIGRSDEQELVQNNDFDALIQVVFPYKEINLDDKISSELKNELFSTKNYSDIILKGAKIIDEWNY